MTPEGALCAALAGILAPAAPSAVESVHYSAIAETAVAAGETTNEVMAEGARQHDAMAPAIDEIASLGRMPVDWTSEGCDRPSTAAVQLAASIATIVGRRPDHIAPMADGGIALWYSHDEVSIRVEAVNEGEAVVVTRANAESAPEYQVTGDARRAALMIVELLR